MRQNIDLKISQEQKLVMTQQMQLSIKLLQMSAYDLREYINEEFAENPLLEGEFNVADGSLGNENEYNHKELINYLETNKYEKVEGQASNSNEQVSPLNYLSKVLSLSEYLKEQVIDSNEDKNINMVLFYLIDNLDSRGYLDMELSLIAKELNVSEEIVDIAIKKLQELEPYGIGARDIGECLKIQLKKRGMLENKIEIIIDKYLELVADNKFKILSEKMGIAPLEAQNYGDLIKTLEPKPSRGFYTGDDIKYIIPDATIKKMNQDYIVMVNDSIVPKLSVSNIYKELLNSTTDENVDKYLKDRLNRAIFLIKSIEQRKSTLAKVLEKIVVRQKDYLEKGEKHLKPMMLKEISEELGIHESTVSRAIKEKYILTDRGTIKIKDMFKSGLAGIEEQKENISTVYIKNNIKELIEAEDKSKPLSDQIIVDKLKKNKLNISRRTVAKYREELGIKASSKRRRI